MVYEMIGKNKHMNHSPHYEEQPLLHIWQMHWPFINTTTPGIKYISQDTVSIITVSCLEKE